MAETMQFDLVSPERSLMSAQVKSVQIPGADGDMTAMPNHAPLITTLRPGVLKVETDKGIEEFVVTGGFAELGESLSVLAERAVPKADVDQAAYEAMVDEAHAAYKQTKETFKNEPGPVDDAAKLLADMVAVGTHIGLSPKQPSL
ncbi:MULTISPECIES: F0F1 ATP synthase subunit epsilon [Marivita]|jgi:F-type H+-transporting ATPase subunit epsilon|uniref:ATP synthase epsilon chain n=1 Tax=Marivita cryptomonadis TaxID=505252 RepID=A0A9Q2S1P3_9RHOB|nr:MULTISPECIES: F0F1 ATP synthase subunit epsilon [Marivita]MCR9168969.1 F0F1 ATP synthase subunit epsilon [Paracoccaceae bacterium]MBM2321600.1 F0F1 ATP synthase subunit epsilon [Marivita cryptomonadis]MBM2331181.1 F0F1 ATP synthase subunit epsilon [Marivita cryptomonadis]MBM2340767.1 F0F1 ATP synthase subunit epsilon [Marivita cryptomonadis]MBM2345429.1 F0F1 ATP synthase subunit epsilon [Marivita cryptomonadis]